MARIPLPPRFRRAARPAPAARRAVLKGLALGAAGALAGGGHARSRGAAPRAVALLPGGATGDVAAGLRLGLEAAGAAVDLTVAPDAPLPSGARAALEAALRGRPDLIVARLEPAAEAAVADLPGLRDLPLLALASGADLPAGPAPALGRLGLERWRRAWALGAEAVRSGGPRVLVAASLRAVGHDHVIALQRAVAVAGGEAIEVLTDGGSGPSGPDALAERVAALAPDAVVALHADAAGALRLRRALEAGLPAERVLADAALLRGEAGALLGARAAGIRTVVAWDPALATPAGRDLRALARRDGLEPGPALALGFDAGLLLADRVAGGTGAVEGARGRLEPMPGGDLRAPLRPARADGAGGLEAFGTIAGPAEADGAAVAALERSGFLDAHALS